LPKGRYHPLDLVASLAARHARPPDAVTYGRCGLHTVSDRTPWCHPRCDRCGASACRTAERCTRRPHRVRDGEDRRAGRYPGPVWWRKTPWWPLRVAGDYRRISGICTRP